ncbi:MAG: hypothetical protein IT371_08690 [Deltaproteobacteria bacterium]|nr:hypothetical protein [Deltaproteobacteria bacterium]
MSSWTRLAAVMLIGVLAGTGCEGPSGKDGLNGTNGVDGKDGVVGKDGVAGKDAVACWDTNANATCDAATEDRNGDKKCDVLDCQGAAGLTGLPLEAAGIVGVVTDTTRQPVQGVKVYLVPATDIPTAALTLGSDIAAVRADPNDEPLEDTIAAKGAGYTQATTSADGVYRIPSVPAGKYFVVALPDATDTGHLPGGSLCRKAQEQKDLVGKQWNIQISTKPSAKAKYVGPSVCLTCHGVVHELSTLHMLGLRKVGVTGPLQDSSRFPDWNRALATKFTVAGTWLYFYGYGGTGTPAAPNFKVSEKDPGTGISFKARLYSNGAGKYFVDLVNVKDPTQPMATYEVEMTYGGGIYKQRYLAKLPDGSRYVLPIQFNFEGQATETGTPASRWVWQHYNAQNWYDEAKTTAQLKTPAKTKSFDNNCAGCHFSGFKLTGDATAGFKAHGVPDPKGEMDYDGDGKPEAINISCENCHGPGSEHWAKAGGAKAIVSPRLLTPEREVAICGQCHTRALGIGGANTETPMNADGMMMHAGTSRKDFLTNYVSKIDDGLWDATKGDGKQSVKHHQQASDFMKTKKYRNQKQLLACSSCHDPHGVTEEPHQLDGKLDSVSAGKGQCLSCHDATFTAGATVGERMQAHWASYKVSNTAMGDIRCTDCHMPLTAKSGAGRAQAAIAGVTYYSGDISSHLFQVPLRTAIKPEGKGAEMMPIPYTNKCGTCHTTAP